MARRKPDRLCLHIWTRDLDYFLSIIIAGGARAQQGSDDYGIEIHDSEGYSDNIDVSGVQGQFFYIFDVPQAGDYNITVQNAKQEYQVGTIINTLTWLRPTAFTQFDDT